MFPAMDSRILLVLLVSLLTHLLLCQSKSTTPKISVMGIVYCDVCSNNTFVGHSYFLPGVEVHLNCKFKATSPTTREEITFSVNRTTDKHGVYRLEIPSVDGISCAEGLSMESHCQASLIGSSSSCSVPGLKTTTDGITVKSKHANICIYSLNALNFRPKKRNVTLCGYEKETSEDDLNSSKFFFPFFPPFPFPFPYPPMPSLPPFPSLPFPPLPPFPSLPFPFPMPPSLPFPFPTFPPTPSSAPPALNFKDPKTWIPYPTRNSLKQNP